MQPQYTQICVYCTWSVYSVVYLARVQHVTISELHTPLLGVGRSHLLLVSLRDERVGHGGGGYGTFTLRGVVHPKAKTPSHC
jgi:hypothetical protein